MAWLLYGHSSESRHDVQRTSDEMSAFVLYFHLRDDPILKARRINSAAGGKDQTRTYANE